MLTSGNVTMRLARLCGLLLGTAAVMLLTVSSAGAVTSEPAPVSPSLARWMATAAPDETVQVMVHGTDLAAAERAVTRTGMSRITEFRSIDVVVACATPAQVEAARDDPGVTYLEGEQTLTTSSTGGERSHTEPSATEQGNPTQCRQSGCTEPGSGDG